MNSKRIIIPAVLVLLLLVVYSQRSTLVMALMERSLPKIMASDPAAALGEGLHIAVCGAGGPEHGQRIPAPERVETLVRSSWPHLRHA